jgi:AraC family transcriptional regulator
MVTKLAPGEFFGQERQRRAFGGLRFIETVYPDGMVIPKHEHADGYLSFALAGFHRQHIDRRTRDVSPRTLTVHPQGEVHANHWHGGGHCLNVEITPARLGQIREYARCLDQPSEFRKEVAAGLAGRLYEEFRLEGGASALALEGLTLEILAEIARNPLPGPGRTLPPWLRRARELLHEQFSENLSLSDVARAVGVHPAHLGRAFRRHFGSTPGHYVRKVRVAFARSRLANTDEPLVAIALAAGFTDQSHFTNVFRQATGLTPADYRKRRQPRSSPANGRGSRPRSGPSAALP